VHPGSPVLADQGQTGGWARRCQPKRPVWTMSVVVLDIDPEDLFQMTTANDQQPVQALGADGADPALRIGVRVRRLDWREEHLGTLGAEYVVEPTAELRVPVADKKRTRQPRSASTKSRLRACWVTQVLLGLAVTPGRWTRRVSCSMKNST
jgi:hypothetical protein